MNTSVHVVFALSFICQIAIVIWLIYNLIKKPKKEEVKPQIYLSSVDAENVGKLRETQSKAIKDFGQEACNLIAGKLREAGLSGEISIDIPTKNKHSMWIWVGSHDVTTTIKYASCRVFDDGEVITGNIAPFIRDIEYIFSEVGRFILDLEKDAEESLNLVESANIKLNVIKKLTSKEEKVII